MNNGADQIKLELLSPAKNLETGKTAVLAGADAVYIGGPAFSARAAVGNSWEDIRSLCSFAHEYYAKVYLAVNTIFYDGEVGRVQDTLNRAQESGTDGIIIQDMGILKLDLPPIPLIASTQCHNYDPEHIRFLRNAGFSRAILARELSLEQIRKIADETPGIELEAFVHGSLCVSYSGRCGFSNYLTGRSANRGECVQACRLPFSLTDKTGKLIVEKGYLLSAKDLCMLGRLNDLISSGVTSFKIEGRLKDQAYTGNVTAAYSKELDQIVKNSAGKYRRASSGRCFTNFEPDIQKSFNRGFTHYFYYGRKETVISETGQKSLGEYIGVVKELSRNYFTLDRPHDLKNGDGVCWTGADGELEGVNINLVEGGKIFPFKKFPNSVGVKIYRNEDPAFERSVISGLNRKIAVNIEAGWDSGRFKLKAVDEDSNSVELTFSHDRTKAKDRENSVRSWEKQMSKTGGTIFELKDFRLISGADYFVPVSVLNGWRRGLLGTLLEVRMENYSRPVKVRGMKIPEIKEKFIGPLYNVSNSLAAQFYREAGAEEIELAAEVSEIRADVPLMTTKHCIKYHIGACPKYGGNTFVEEPLYLSLNGRKFRLEFDCAKCEMLVFPPKKEKII